jgi:hypothetical protein
LGEIDSMVPRRFLVKIGVRLQDTARRTGGGAFFVVALLMARADNVRMSKRLERLQANVEAVALTAILVLIFIAYAISHYIGASPQP